MNISDIFPNKYLRGADLQGHAVMVRIINIQLESFYDSEHKADVKKPVLFFEGKQKGLILIEDSGLRDRWDPQEREHR